MTPKEFYEKHATNVCNVPRVGHPEDPSGWAGVRRASEARLIAADCPVMTLADAFDFAEKYAHLERAERCPKCGLAIVPRQCANPACTAAPDTEPME